MLQYLLDADTCIHVMKTRTPQLRGRFNRLAELHYGAAKSGRPVENREAVEHFAARLDVLPFSAKAAAHYGQLRVELERAGTPAGAHDMLIGAHARAEGLIVVSSIRREFARMPGVRVESWV